MGVCFSSENIEELKDLKYDDVDYFSFKNMEFYAKIVDVYDGDTCTVIFKFHDEIVKFKCRCIGYDSPEMKPSKTISDDVRLILISNAHKSKNYFINQLTSIDIDPNTEYLKKETKELLNNNKKIIKIKTHDWDKYGRLLTEFYNDKGECVNDLMIKNCYGYAYDGGTKKVIDINV
jgi:endonuclease YncB( thermonuclease family)